MDFLTSCSTCSGWCQSRFCLEVRNRIEPISTLWNRYFQSLNNWCFESGFPRKKESTWPFQFALHTLYPLNSRMYCPSYLMALNHPFRITFDWPPIARRYQRGLECRRRWPPRSLVIEWRLKLWSTWKQLKSCFPSRALSLLAQPNRTAAEGKWSKWRLLWKWQWDILRD